MTYNTRLQPVQIGLGTSSTDSSVLKLDYGYSATSNNGNALSQTISIGATVMSQSYGYDALNRLQSATESGAWSQSYAYDRYGNRAVTSSSGYTLNPLTPTTLSAYNASTNRLTANGYDGSGNQMQEGVNRTFTYDAENRQLTFNGTAGQYAYDGDGRRVKKVDGTGTTVMVYDAGGRLIAEYTSGNPTGSGTSYLTADHLGSTRVVIKGDGTVKARYDYLPFGEEIGAGIGQRTGAMGYSASDNTRQKFTAKERDNESGLDYFIARYHSSAQGRFTSVDPYSIVLEIQFAGDSKVERSRFVSYLSDPRKWNRYPYAVNNPLLYIDPSGEEIILNGGTADQQEAVRISITRLRDQSTSADQAFARFDGTGPDAPNLTITILDDKDFEAQITSNVDKSKAQGLTESGGIVENVDPKTGKSTFIVNVNVSLRSSAINLSNDRQDAKNNSESRTEGILSHEVGGHAVDLSRNPREYQANSTRDRNVPYEQRANERFANAASFRIVIQRFFSSSHLRQMKSGLHWLN